MIIISYLLFLKVELGEEEYSVWERLSFVEIINPPGHLAYIWTRPKEHECLFGMLGRYKTLSDLKSWLYPDSWVFIASGRCVQVSSSPRKSMVDGTTVPSLIDLKVVGLSAGLRNPALRFRLTWSQGDEDCILQCWIKDQIQDDLDNFLFAGSLATSNLF